MVGASGRVIGIMSGQPGSNPWMDLGFFGSELLSIYSCIGCGSFLIMYRRMMCTLRTFFQFRIIIYQKERSIRSSIHEQFNQRKNS